MKIECFKSLFPKVKLGSGTSLPSVVARKLTNINKIILTDNLSNENQKLEDLIKFTLLKNDISFTDALKNLNEQNVLIQRLDWTCYDLELIEAWPKIDLIIGSDVFFDSKCKEENFIKF